MFVPHETGKMYRIKTVHKTDHTEMVWEGKASCIADAFMQAREAHARNPTTVVISATGLNSFAAWRWTEFLCQQLDMTDNHVIR